MRGVLFLLFIVICVSCEASTIEEDFVESARQCANSLGKLEKLKDMFTGMFNPIEFIDLTGINVDTDKYIDNGQILWDRVANTLSGSANNSDDLFGGIRDSLTGVRDSVVGAGTELMATVGENFPLLSNLLSGTDVPLDQLGTTLSTYSPSPLAMVGGLAAGVLGLLVGSNFLTIPINFASITTFFNDMLTGLDRGDILQLDEYHSAANQADYLQHNQLPAYHELPAWTYPEEFAGTHRAATTSLANKVFQALRTYREQQQQNTEGTS